MADLLGDRRGEDSDSELIVASVSDGRRFSVVFDRHYDRIWGYLSRRAGAAAADDLASETFLRAFAARLTYDRTRHDAGPWLYGIATNLLRERSRGEQRRDRAYARAVERDITPDGVDDADGRLDAHALGPKLLAALATLSVDDRDALLLLALTDLQYEGIAAATDVPVGTVRSRLHRARRQLRAQLGGKVPLQTPRHRSTR